MLMVSQKMYLIFVIEPSAKRDQGQYEKFAIENKGMLRDEEKTPEEAEEAVPKVEAPVVVAK